MLLPLIVGGALVVLLALRVMSVLHGRNDLNSRTTRSTPISTVVVLGSGGHTTEMLQLLQSLNPDLYQPLTFIVAKTDTTSMRRVEAMSIRRPDVVYHIPRAREVGQSYLTSIGTTIWSLMFTLALVFRIRPGLLLCNGPGTCLPIAVWTFMGRILGLWEGKIVFCESFCRVTRYEPMGLLAAEMEL
jgi:beta-1,4-N-acetylglucosaminyltransferase